jgi:hypothetical protein
MTTRPRSQEMKHAFYQTVTGGLAERCGIASQYVMFSVIENSDADWSSAFGKAHCLLATCKRGELVMTFPIRNYRRETSRQAGRFIRLE